MVKPDVRHNYYADLELPTNASIEDIRKSYRKLALQYHPDRNGGREDECIPKFQAIQMANEVLSDPGMKQKYDNDRRKAGLYPTFTPGSRSNTPGNMYTATSAYPPPPRRTPAPTSQRPTSGGAPPPTSATGADRFSNFARPGSAKKDPAQDRTNAFKAWQNMQGTTGKEQTQRFGQPPPPQQPPQGTQQRRAPPPPPPRQEPRPQPEDLMRGGPKYKAPPPFDPEGVDKRQSNWSAFQSTHAGKPGMPGVPQTSPPNKPPPNVNMPPPPRPEDFGRGRPTVNVPPPRPNGPSTNTSPETPISPKMQRPRPDPLRPFKSHKDQVPFAEGNRVSTPYSQSYMGGEKTDFFGEGIRRSHSVRDTSKLSPGDRSHHGRARSSSPQRANTTPRDGQQDKFDLIDSSEESSDEERTKSTSQNPDRPGTAPHATGPFERPKKTPMPPSSRFNGTRSGPETPQPTSNSNGANGRAQSDGEQQGPARQNMYAPQFPSPSSTASCAYLNSQTWTSRMFGSYSTSSAEPRSSRVPKWAIPSSVNPALKRDKLARPTREKPDSTSYVTAADELFVKATEDEQRAYLRFQAELRKEYDNVPGNLDMGVFPKLISMASRNEYSGEALLDQVLKRVLAEFESVGTTDENIADDSQSTNSFDYTPDPDHYANHDTRSRSTENVNTSFADGWNGSFSGDPEYFAPPRGTGRKPPSPRRRPPNPRAPTSHPRSSTMDDYQTPNASQEQVPQRPYGSDGTPSGVPRYAASNTGFDSQHWQSEFRDPEWTQPTTAPTSAPSVRKPSESRKTSKPRKATGARNSPHVVDDNDATRGDVRPEGSTAVDDADAMDIDDTPPFHAPPDGFQTEAPNQTTGARVYSVPPSEWRQQQEQKQQAHSRKSSSASRRSRSGTANGGAKFNANLDDLRDSLSQTTNDLSSTLPFQSQTSPTMYGDPSLPRDLTVPSIPKPPPEPQRLSKNSWQTYAAAFGEYVRQFHHLFNTPLLQHFESREQQAHAQIATGMGWLEATGDTSGMLTAPTGFGTYMRGVKEDVKVREAWLLGWEKHNEAVVRFQGMRDRVRKLVVGGMLVEN